LKKQNIERKIKELIRNDDAAALEVIYDEYGNRIYKYLLSVLCSEEKARDIMQNLFVAIAEKRFYLVKARNLEGYIFIMARNQAMDFLREQSTKERYERDFQDYENILVAKIILMKKQAIVNPGRLRRRSILCRQNSAPQFP